MHMPAPRVSAVIMDSYRFTVWMVRCFYSHPSLSQIIDMTENDASAAIEPIPIPHAYTTLLRSNACPSTEACTDIHFLIDQHQRQLATIQDHVTRLKACLADMEGHQAHTEDTLVKLHAALAPIKRLPPELLSEIFEHCLDGSNAVLFSGTARHSEAPLLLGRVCRSWRTVAHATPRLWRDIVVNVCDGRYSEELRRDALPVLQTWLAHSGSLPLKLDVLCKTERVLPGLMDLFEIIATHGARWKTVHVRLQNSPVIYRLVCRAFSKCTGLSMFDVTDGGQCMSFFGTRQPDEVEDVRPVRFDLSLAPLEQLSLSLAGLGIREVHAAWGTLTRLSFMQDARSSTTSITDYASILGQCTSLRECAIAIDSGVRDGPLEGFTLPSLECLRIQVLREASHTTQTGDFLSALHAPRLRALSVEDCCPRRDVVLYHSQLKAFLHEHQESLQHLRFSTSSKHFTSDDMIGLVVETPFLVELEYRPDEESSPNALLEALTPRVRGDVLACLLPCLERLFVYWDTKETVSMVGDMIEKRANQHGV
ncbi:hypothetical protein L210DRAFT_3645879 [Boletus edulis BED1]|uniref:F-box domain-containing protein n=1 Tax=Boletus edulis BED1 TaxID=1328754 RepID=A0AAD4BTZ0_BOLED|nr:hypothetical protein L210DRAFT_3645879 [Boletus edulis BED1]